MNLSFAKLAWFSLVAASLALSGCFSYSSRGGAAATTTTTSTPKVSQTTTVVE